MKISKQEETKLMEMIVDLDKQIKRLKIRKKNYKKQLIDSEQLCFCGAKQRATCGDNRAYRVCENGHEKL